MSRLDWPTFLDRTTLGDRSNAKKFSVTLAQAFDDLEGELGRLGVDDYRYSFDAQQRKRDGRPYSRARPDDPGFVLRWSVDGDSYAAACDEFTALRDNVRAVGLWLRETRKRSSRPVRTADTKFAAARLPSGDDDAIAAGPRPYDVLGVSPDPTDSEVRDAFRKKVKQVHPDAEDGDEEAFRRVKRARDDLLGGDEE
ncbi:DnaJ domain-containing protein [Haloarchaeobius sp. DFWS5]|uniref:DnaJ domain-containing protein n=1 Tax=Haloarchaeobius sp. DFWS5 TaxID=3446114 RepID=UPI003EBCC8DE